MGEARKKSNSRAAILSAATRCIYCANIPDTIEHMPPRSLFASKMRPSGLEFPACKQCNGATRGADTTASLFAWLGRSDYQVSFWRGAEGQRILYSAEKDAPGVRDEIFHDPRPKNLWLPEQNGLLTRRVQVDVNGPLAKAYLDIFSAKLGMAFYYEHVGRPLELKGGVRTQWFLNSGLSEAYAQVMLQILPRGSTLRQGTFQVPDQFFYRYNCDNKSIFAALVSLRGNLHISVVATSEPEKFGIGHDTVRNLVGAGYMRPGGLVEALPRAKVHPTFAPIWAG
ncbi:hypothetical protein AAAK29_31270 [Mesorhizobium sp. CCNWLW179-1]|uniref:hypothetical protein n=1 Tax=unclassified Mesorhizobium TaxID=325217 RepID=UPI003014C60D